MRGTDYLSDVDVVSNIDSVIAIVALCSDAYRYENNRHFRPAVSDVYPKPPSNFSLLLKCVLSDMGVGECPVSFHTHTVHNYTLLVKCT